MNSVFAPLGITFTTQSIRYWYPTGSGANGDWSELSMDEPRLQKWQKKTRTADDLDLTVWIVNDLSDNLNGVCTFTRQPPTRTPTLIRNPHSTQPSPTTSPAIQASMASSSDKAASLPEANPPSSTKSATGWVSATPSAEWSQTKPTTASATTASCARR